MWRCAHEACRHHDFWDNRKQQGPAMSEYLLEVKDLCMRFGGLLAVDHVGFNVRPQEVFAIIGPNGAGKTTVFNCISGFYQPSSGSVTLDGSAIEGRSSHHVANHGVVRTRSEERRVGKECRSRWSPYH